LTERPQGSTASFTPTNTAADPSLFLDLTGTYRAQLEVTDSNGMTSCAPSTVVIVATPDQDIHLQLVWDTPGDNDQTDGSGADLDIHYKRDSDPWNGDMGDLYWHYPDRDWGVQGDMTDDPSLDIDDTNGAGPENVSHDNPPDDTYSVGVYYYADNGYGPSYATVRIYIAGALAQEFDNKFLAATGKFWYVADLEWPSATITPIDQVTDNFPTP